MNTQARITAAEKALDAHQDATASFEASPEEAVIDLLTNLRHLCRGADLDFPALVRRSKSHELAELD